MLPLDSGFTVTIANGGTISPAVDLNGHGLCGIYLPAAFTGTAITFLASDLLAGTYRTVQDGAGSALTKVVSAGVYVPLDPADFAGIRYLKIVSNAAEGGARILTLAARLF